MVKYQSPVNYSHISVGFSDRHPALDMGWLLKYKNDKNKSYNQPIYAIGNGKVLFNGNTSDGGKTLVIAHSYNSTHDLWAGYSHNSKHDVKVGDIVKQGDKIANMGETGAPGQPHVHLRTSLVKKGTAFSWSNFNKVKRENPLDWIYEYPHQEVDGIKKLPKDKPKKKSNSTIAKEVINGKWGNGADRKNRLEKAGYNYNAVQKEVNKLVSNKPTAKPKLKSNAVIAQEIMAGKWGNGQARKNALEKAGYNYKAVQKEVDKLLTKKPTTSKPKVERVKVAGKHYLYKNHTGTDIYGSGKQNLKSRNMEVLERRNGRVRVDAKPYFKTVNGKKVPVFDVDSFWVKL